MVVSEINKHILQITCNPCVLGAYSGNKLYFFLAYFTDRVYVTLLGSPMRMDVSFRSNFESPEVIDLARRLQVIRNTARRLRESYLKVHTGEPMFPPSHLFPRLRHFVNEYDPDLASELANIVLHDQLNYNGNNLTFKGLLRHRPDSVDGHPVVVKFVPEYGREVHDHLARYRRQRGDLSDETEDYPLAPKLWICKPLMRGLMVVVTELLEGTPFCPDIDKGALADLDLAVDELQRRGYVHGDLRSPNIIVQRHGDQRRAFVIDFDSAGRVGEARYSMYLNPEAGWFFDDVEARCGRLVGEDDDRLMVNHHRRLVKAHALEEQDQLESQERAAKRSKLSGV
ncbi:hypothetical protein C8Q76DRAFT_723707 [Earliella scabrosa]|nr:hypothetical protein C8Q76DRAFT_723707 [Earliella scabrosa]